MISGPEATAGSTPIWLKKIGIAIPTKLKISIARSNDNPIQAEIANAADGG